MRSTYLLALFTLVACAPPTMPEPEAPVPAVEAPAPAVETPVDPGATELSYTLSFADADRNRVRVRARAKQGCGVWWMSTWIPGSYVIREFPRHVESVTAHGPDGPLGVVKQSKDSWVVLCEGTHAGQPVELSYTVAARELSVRTSYVDDAGAVLNPTSWAIVPTGVTGPISVSLTEVDWPSVHTPLPPQGDGWLAEDLDALMDAPMIAGTTTEHRFEVDGIPHLVATLDPDGFWSHERIRDDVRAIVEVQRDFFGGLPYEQYQVLNALGGRGGLEHDDSTLLVADAFAGRMDAEGEPVDPEAYRGWLSVVSHELFHVWNVRRLRPEGLCPQDYRKEQYTSDLWIAEGLTSYYDSLLLARAGHLTEEQLLEAISKEVKAVADAPGRTVQPLSQASMDAWVEFYRKDEHSRNQGVSYYRKGALVGLILDVNIRRATNGRKSLDDAMRLAWTRHGADPGGYSSRDFDAVLDETAGSPIEPMVRSMVYTTEELPLDDALAYLGLMLEPVDASGLAPFHGAELTVSSGGVNVSTVLRDTPAWEAGVMPGDELVAVDGWRLHDLSRLDAMDVGEHTWTVVRRGRLRDVSVTTMAASPSPWKVVVDPNASQAATRLRRSWLEGR